MTHVCIYLTFYNRFLASLFNENNLVHERIVSELVGQKSDKRKLEEKTLSSVHQVVEYVEGEVDDVVHFLQSTRQLRQLNNKIL